jgi:hypothetical protein
MSAVECKQILGGFRKAIYSSHAALEQLFNTAAILQHLARGKNAIIEYTISHGKNRF